MKEWVNTRLELKNFGVLILFNSENSILSFQSMCVDLGGCGKEDGLMKSHTLKLIEAVFTVCPQIHLAFCEWAIGLWCALAPPSSMGDNYLSLLAQLRHHLLVTFPSSVSWQSWSFIHIRYRIYHMVMKLLACVISAPSPRLRAPYWLRLMLYSVSQSLIAYLALSRFSVNSSWMHKCVSAQNKGREQPTDQLFPECFPCVGNFMCIFWFMPHDTPLRLLLLSLFYR